MRKIFFSLGWVVRLKIGCSEQTQINGWTQFLAESSLKLTPGLPLELHIAHFSLQIDPHRLGGIAVFAFLLQVSVEIHSLVDSVYIEDGVSCSSHARFLVLELQRVVLLVQIDHIG